MTTIELLQFAPKFGLPNASPFCMKVEVFLRLAGLPYRTVEAMPLRTPKGKLPVLRAGGLLVPDSQDILAWLQATQGDRLPAALRTPDTPVQHALRRMLEEHLYFAALWFRWIEPAGWVHTRGFFDGLPPGVRGLVGGLVRRKMRRDLIGQGLGRQGRDQIGARAAADLDALAGLLGEQPFFGGAVPAAVDACAYAFLANLIWVPVPSPMKDHALRLPTLVAYCERMRVAVGA